MDAMFCPECGLKQPADHRFCVRCGVRLPSDWMRRSLPKRARWFAGMQVDDTDPRDAFLRVSCYLQDQIVERPEGPR
ncbi:MAG: hypothetical protein ACRDI1_06530, partial [Actinomycetota bacterium]